VERGENIIKNLFGRALYRKEKERRHKGRNGGEIYLT